MADAKFALSAAFVAAFVDGVFAQTDDSSSTADSTADSSSASSASASSTTDSSSSASATSTSSTSSSTRSSTRSSTTTATGTSTDLSLPTLTQTVATTPSYPAASVPPTNEAPFMHRSKAPDGTVFIAVGAILGAVALAVLLWRGIVACMLHRSVERAARAQVHANDKTAYPLPPAAPFYKYTDRESSSASLAHNTPDVGTASVHGTTRRANPRSSMPAATPSMSNLFYSPTAAPSAGVNANRDSRFLPAGFYATGASPAPPVGTSIGMSNLRPESRGGGAAAAGYSRSNLGTDASPDASPHFGPQRRDISTSSLNLNAGGGSGRPGSARAPSAYLEDMLDENPHMFPSQGGHGYGHQGRQSYGGGRF
ncbi:hypothetical protein TD95_002533 [Thielaviopsis punctulata]|uniref:CSI2 protein n=1 Tax=Thielaviopsis punctulata TaxID=72032 RepID=A0A0F4ZD67_9PEZI|nr:hypothetical protein TD95_002533 [Thielaviopsis punctulata]